VTQRWLEDAGGPPPSRYTRVVLAADAVVARSVDATVVVAPPLRDFLVDRLHVPARRVVHIDNGLALPEAVLRERAVTELLFVGLLVERKGVHLLLDALAVAPAHLRLTVVGDGPQRADLEARAAALGLDGRVRFLGFRSDVPDLLAAADAFVLPSLMEQQPLVLIEAMGSGLPVVATRVGGVPDLVGDAGPSGGTLVVPPGDVGALGAALTRLAGLDAGQVGAVGRIAAQRARDRFSLATCVEQHVLLYARLSFGEPKSRLTEASGMA
jgi:glycosyltransferase involved in cell wall biosynthesis